MNEQICVILLDEEGLYIDTCSRPRPHKGELIFWDTFWRVQDILVISNAVVARVKEEPRGPLHYYNYALPLGKLEQEMLKARKLAEESEARMKALVEEEHDARIQRLQDKS